MAIKIILAEFMIIAAILDFHSQSECIQVTLNNEQPDLSRYLLNLLMSLSDTREDIYIYILPNSIKVALGIGNCALSLQTITIECHQLLSDTREDIYIYIYIYILPNSIKVALGIGNCALSFGGHSSRVLHCVRMPKAQLPKQPSLN